MLLRNFIFQINAYNTVSYDDADNAGLIRAHSFSASKARTKEASLTPEKQLIQTNFPTTTNNNHVYSTPVVPKKSYYDSQMINSYPRPSNNRSAMVPPVVNRVGKKNCYATPPFPCLHGIVNHGNTCYMNAILQCLASIDRFAEYFVCQQFESLISPNSKNLVTNSLALTIQSLWLNISADGPSLRLLKLIASANSSFQISIQQDAQESLIWLLDRIHEELKGDQLSRLSNSPSKV